MIDQITPDKEQTNIPEKSFVQANMDNPVTVSLSGGSSETTQPEAPQPTVIMPSSTGGVPKWFYFIFGVTSIMFFIVTTLIVLQISQKPATKSEISPPPIAQVTSKLPALTPTLTNSATDSATNKLNDITTSDDLVSIEADLKNTDLTQLDKAVSGADVETNNSF